MTIAIAIMTGSAIVFASDSKVTTAAPAGADENGKPILLHQAYDNAFKISHDRSRSSMAMFVGAANIGAGDAMSYFSRLDLSLHVAPDKQNSRVQVLVSDIEAERQKFWGASGIERSKWPGPVVLMAAPPAGALTPRLWRLDFSEGGMPHREILEHPGVWLEGSTAQAFTLLYGVNFKMWDAIHHSLAVTQEQMDVAFNALNPIRPVNQINFWTMPLQDAIDLAVFIARVQIEMERFLPGPAACGGPIDVMAMEMAPEPSIKSFPGKTLHHPMGTKI